VCLLYIIAGLRSWPNGTGEEGIGGGGLGVGGLGLGALFFPSSPISPPSSSLPESQATQAVCLLFTTLIMRCKDEIRYNNGSLTPMCTYERGLRNRVAINTALSTWHYLLVQFQRNSGQMNGPCAI
jgi:hypothetical protein